MGQNFQGRLQIVYSDNELTSLVSILNQYSNQKIFLGAGHILVFTSKEITSYCQFMDKYIATDIQMYKT